MPREVSSTPKTNLSAPLSNSAPIASKPKPHGISSSKSSIRSLKPKKVGFIKNFIIKIIESIRNMLRAIVFGIRDVFLCIFPFKSIFLKKQEISEVEKRYYDYQKKLYRVDSLSTMLANNEAKEILQHFKFNAFEKLGEIELEKETNTSDLRINEELFSQENKINLGKKIAKKNPPLELIAILKEYYKDQISKLENQLKIEKKYK